jgi:hypothetical protein
VLGHGCGRIPQQDFVFIHHMYIKVYIDVHCSDHIFSQICPDGHLSLTVICVLWPVCFCPSAAHSLLKKICP